MKGLVNTTILTVKARKAIFDAWGNGASMHRIARRLCIGHALVQQVMREEMNKEARK